MPSLNNLPLQLTSFIGREREITEVKRLLASSRLLTLTGAGGSGKTRLALQVVSQFLDAYPDGVFFVNLAPITDHNLVVSTIAQTLNVKEVAGQPLIETLNRYLQGRDTLLVLDNFEQVLEVAPQVVELLKAAPDLKVMVTSRESLHVQGEQLYSVLPLDLPDPKHLERTSVEELPETEAVRLFVERAQSAMPNFSLTSDNMQAVAEVCTRLDGLPLAIELVAARIPFLSPQAMLSRLASRLKLVTGGARDLPSRHQTLRATIEWSYDLLSEEERQLFRCMSAFVGGRSLEALDAVRNSEGLQLYGSLEVDMLEGVSALVDKNLLQQREGIDGEPRFWMLETIHEYAREKLRVSGEAEILYREHALYYMKMAEEAEPHLTGKKQQEWLDRLEDAYDNIRAALSWSAEQARRGSQEVAEIGLRTAGALYRFWYVRGLFTEGRHQLERTLSVPDDVLQACSTGRKATALNGAGALAWRQGDYSSARSLLEGALLLGRTVRDKPSISSSLNNLGNVAWEQGDYTGARALHEESLALRRELGDKWGIAASLSNLGLVAHQQGDYTGARALLDEGLALRRELGDKWAIANTLGNLGLVAHEQEDYAGAHTLHEESLGLFREIGDKWGIANTLGNLGLVAHEQEDYTQARSLRVESLALFRDIGDKKCVSASLVGLGGVAVRVGQVEKGAKLLGAVETLVESIGAVLDRADRLRYERAVAFARSQLGEGAFETAWQEGRVMSMEQAIAYALEEVAEPEPNIQSLPSTPSPYELTRREVELLGLLVEGLTNEQIAQRLFLSPNTVRAHLHSIYSKLDVGNRGAAARFAVENNLV